MAKTALPKRYKVTPDLLRDIEKHCYSTLDYEVGGMLFGKLTASATQINGHVPALKASKDVVTLTFTHDVWEAILKEGEEKFPGQQIVGWYHTHPSFGIFLSDYDKFIQTQFFSQKGQVALVVDPVAGKLGWFETNGDDVRQIAADVTATGPKQKRAGQIPAGSKKRPSMTALVIASTASLAFGIGLGAAFSVGQTPPDLSGSVASLEGRVSQLEGELFTFGIPGSNQWQDRMVFGFAPDGTPLVEYTSIQGDTAESIALQFYGNPVDASQLLAFNPGLDFENLPPDSRVIVPRPTLLGLVLREPPPLEEEPSTLSPSTSSSAEVDSSVTSSEGVSE